MRKFVSIILIGIVLVGGAALLYPWIHQNLTGLIALLRPAPPLPQGETLPFALPDGFEARLFAADLPGARVLALDPKGALLLSQTSEGKVVVLPNLDSDGKADRAVVVLQGLDRPHGLVVSCSETDFESVDQDDCTLYVAEQSRVSAYRYDADTYTATFEKKLMDLPASGGHFTRSLYLTPDATRLLVAVGSSCNVCHESDERRAAIHAINLQSGTTSLYARGLRNTVFLTTHPVDGSTWGSDMGRDYLGDELPPDEINIIREGANYGWPACYGKNVHDTDFDKNTYIRNPCMEPFENPSHIDIPAHSAPLGLAFIPEEGWPEDWWFDLLVAYHGSWNRSTPAGYKIVRIDLDAQGRPTGQVHDFMTGFLTLEGIVGRPVDIMLFPGGTMYVSDDRAGAVYRITRTSLE